MEESKIVNGPIFPNYLEQGGRQEHQSSISFFNSSVEDY
jgi:hypothetical protein